MLFKISNSYFYTQKVAYFVFKHSSSPVKASNFNSLNPDYYAVSPTKPDQNMTTTLYPRSTYDLWKAGPSPTIFQPVEKLIPRCKNFQSGTDQPPLHFRPTYALPDQGPLIADPPIFIERVGSALWCERALDQHFI